MKKGRFGGLSDTYEVLENATVFPHATDNSCGVLDSEGRFCAFSRGVMGPRRASTEPQMPETHLPRIEGNYLYGGWLRAHFGHFLLESTSRFWLLDELQADFDGILFTQFRKGGLGMAYKRYGSFLDILSGGVPIRLLREPTQVERVFVADPGFGHDYLMCASPRYRALTRAQVDKAVQADGPEKLYVSRSALPRARGGVVAETRIEELMITNGYAVFHPQKHSIPEQLARYKAARKLVALDGSALHMAAYALKPDAQVGMILRRQMGLLDKLAQQIELFSGATVNKLDALCASWIDPDAKRVDFRSIGELDFDLLQAQLTEKGFIAPSPPIGNLTEADIRSILDTLGRGAMRRVSLD